MVTSHADSPAGDHLTVYSSLPFYGQTATAAREVFNGEKLALAHARHHAGSYGVRLVSLNDSSQKGVWESGIAEANAKRAANDPSTIAYIGDLESGATAVSLPLNNNARLLQVSPSSAYVGLTSGFDAGQGDPERFYPRGGRNLVRLLPGDLVQGAAQVALMRRLRVNTLYVLNDGEPFKAPLATIVSDDATQAGIDVVGEGVVEVAKATGESSFKSQIEAILRSGAQAVFFSGEADEGAAAFWRQLHEADPLLLLLGSSVMAQAPFTALIQDAASMTYLTSEVLPASRYPAAAKPVLKAYRKRFRAAPSAYALCGYEAMSLVLAAVRAAGADGNDRAAVVHAAFALGERKSVLGRYSILHSGETTLMRYAVDRIRDGMPVFWHELQLGMSPLARAQHLPEG